MERHDPGYHPYPAAGGVTDAQAVARGLDTLTRWSAAMEWEDVPEPIRRRAALVLADDIAALYAARDEPELVAFQATLARSSGPPESRVFDGRGTLLDRYSAAVANGGAMDWAELDEGYRLALCHGGLYCLPALLAEADAGGASIADLLRALVIGYETCARIARCFTWDDLTLHAHGSLAAVGAAASIAALRRLPAENAAAAINMAATMVAPGPFNHAIEGALIRNVWPGVAAWSGMRAVDWLGAGIGGLPTGLHDVYARVFGGAVHPGALTKDLGENYALADGYHKAFACCQYAHAAIEATLALRARAAPAQIAEIHIDTHWRGRNLDNPNPITTLAAKFSMQHALAASAHLGTGGATAFGVSTLDDPTIAALRSRVTIGDFTPETQPPNDRPAHVRWTLKDGTILEETVMSAQGGPDRPFSPADVIAKMRAIIAPVDASLADALNRIAALDPDTLSRAWADTP